MPDLLLEIATAEMSREILQTIAANLSSRVDEALAENSRAQQEIRLFYTPRRVALIASDLPEERFTDRKLTGVVSGILKIASITAFRFRPESAPASRAASSISRSLASSLP